MWKNRDIGNCNPTLTKKSVPERYEMSQMFQKKTVNSVHFQCFFFS